MNAPRALARNQRVHAKKADETPIAVENLNAMVELVGDDEAALPAAVKHRNIARRAQLPGIGALLAQRPANAREMAVGVGGEMPDAIVKTIGNEQRSVGGSGEPLRIAKLPDTDARNFDTFAREHHDGAQTPITHRKFATAPADSAGRLERAFADDAQRTIARNHPHRARGVGDGDRAVGGNIDVGGVSRARRQKRQLRFSASAHGKRANDLPFTAVGNLLRRANENRFAVKRHRAGAVDARDRDQMTRASGAIVGRGDCAMSTHEHHDEHDGEHDGEPNAHRPSVTLDNAKLLPFAP